MRRRRSLPSQLLIAFSVLAVIIGAAMAVGFATVAHQSQSAKQLTGHYQVLEEAGGKLGEAFTTAQFAVLGYSLTGERGFLEPLAGARAHYARRMATLQRRAPAGLRGLVTAQARAGAAWFALVPQIMTVRPGTPAAKALLGQSAGLTQAFFGANVRMEQVLAAQVGRLTDTADRKLSAGTAWSGGAVAMAVLLVLAGSLGTLRTVTGPLRRLAVTVRRLTSGDNAARATVTGSAEVRAVAQAVNTQADESDRLRWQEAESVRLRAMARAGGIRIRAHLAAADVIREARAVLEEDAGADVVYLHLAGDGRIQPPVGHEDDWLLADAFSAVPHDETLEIIQKLFQNHTSLVRQDVAQDSHRAPDVISDSMRAAGIVSVVLTPFGVGEEMLGFVVAHRVAAGRPWTAAEVDAVESIAADIGRGLHHARLYEAENRLVGTLQAVDQAKSDFFATVSHELRAPLTSMEGYLEMLQDEEGGPVTAEQATMLKAVDRSAVRLQDLIDDVFTLSKLESGAFTTAQLPVNIAQVIDGAVEELRPSVTGHGLTLTSDCPADGLIVSGDAGQLGRVLVNLLTNAVKFTPEGGRIAVRAAAEDDSAALTVTDTGIGIPQKDQKELFTRFFRASNALDQAIPGTGLGLAIVRTIVVNHGGDIGLHSQENHGTTFTLHLPLLNPAPPLSAPV